MEEEGVGSTDAAGTDAHEDVLGTGDGALDLDDVDGVDGAGLYGLHGGHGGIHFLKTLRRLLASGSDEPWMTPRPSGPVPLKPCSFARYARWTPTSVDRGEMTRVGALGPGGGRE